MLKGWELAKEIGAYKYQECSAKTQHGVREAFNAAIEGKFYRNFIHAKKANQNISCAISKTKRHSHERGQELLRHVVKKFLKKKP